MPYLQKICVNTNWFCIRIVVNGINILFRLGICIFDDVDLFYMFFKLFAVMFN